MNSNKGMKKYFTNVENDKTKKKHYMEVEKFRIGKKDKLFLNTCSVIKKIPIGKRFFKEIPIGKRYMKATYKYTNKLILLMYYS